MNFHSDLDWYQINAKAINRKFMGVLMTFKIDHDKIDEPKIMISSKLYDFLKVIVTIISPSATALYFVICMMFSFEIEIGFIITNMILTVILGGFLLYTSVMYHISDAYYDGRLLIKEGEEGDLLYTLELNDDPEFIVLKSRISFKVVYDEGVTAAA